LILRSNLEIFKEYAGRYPGKGGGFAVIVGKVLDMDEKTAIYND